MITNQQEVQKRPAAEDLADLVRMVKDIHTALMTSTPKEKKPSKRARLRSPVLWVMQDRGFYTAHILVEKLKSSHPNVNHGSVNSVLYNLHKDGLVERVHYGTYRIPETKSA